MHAPSIIAGVGLGLLAGAGLAAFASRLVLRRAIRRALGAERRARSAERMAELGSMSRGLAHEIKNPLSTIGLNAQLLREGIEDAVPDAPARAPLTRRVDALSRETDRLRGILEDFLEYAGELKLDLREQDCNAVVDELIDFFSPQAAASRVRLRADLWPGPLVARIDGPHLKQALLNLLLNAVQAMSNVSSKPSPSSESSHAADPSASVGPIDTPRELIVRTRAHRDEDGTPMAALHVIDTGPGIPPEVRERIFEPYFTTKSGGTGLGLPTTRRIVDAHGGRLAVHAEPGRGTEFIVLIPTSIAATTSDDAPSSPGRR